MAIAIFPSYRNFKAHFTPEYPLFWANLVTFGANLDSRKKNSNSGVKNWVIIGTYDSKIGMLVSL